nr:hypothetical protein BaRGS_007262 [Batillaria attramentaria]
MTPDHADWGLNQVGMECLWGGIPDADEGLLKLLTILSQVPQSSFHFTSWIGLRNYHETYLVTKYFDATHHVVKNFESVPGRPSTENDRDTA